MKVLVHIVEKPYPPDNGSNLYGDYNTLQLRRDVFSDGSVSSKYFLIDSNNREMMTHRISEDEFNACLAVLFLNS